MATPVRIENDALSLDVWPQIGGKISSLIDKADKCELLFNFPSELPPTSQYDRPYASGWYAGWDECFPAVGMGPYSGHPYDGINVPDHGELWGIPTTTAVPTKNGITTVWHGLRFGYRLTRKLRLEGNALIAEYTLVNLAPFEFRFVWALHALMSMISPIEIEIGAGGGAPAAAAAEAMPFSYEPDDHKAIGQEFNWPTLDSQLDFSKPMTLPARGAWKLFASRPIASAVTVRYPERGRRLSIDYSSPNALAAYWGIWINTGGWAGHHHFAIEPTTGRHDWIDRSVRDGSAGRVGPLAKCEWAVRMTVG